MSESESPIRPKILVGIVTINRMDGLIRTLEECRRLGFDDLVVLDNGSVDGTRQYLAARDDIAKIFTDENGGSSGGFNRIMRFFVEQSNCQWLLTFDDDAFPTFTCKSLSGYLAGLSGSQCPAYAFKVIAPDGIMCDMNRPGVNVLLKRPLPSFRNFHVDGSTGACAVDFASFTGLLLKKETVRAIGLVSKEFFIYGDDTYYTLSISSRIGRLFYCPDFVLVHDCKRSSKRFLNHDPIRLERDVINKIVLIREYSRFKMTYICLYVARSIFFNPALCPQILSASMKGLRANLALYKNEPVCSAASGSR